MNQKTMNILVTLDERYIPYLNVMLSSLLCSNPDEYFGVYLLHSNIRKQMLAETEQILGSRSALTVIPVSDIRLENAPTSARYPYEIYYRIFAAKYLPENLDRIIYLDPDLVVNQSLRELYEMDMRDYYFAAASHTGPVLRKLNEVRLDMEEESPYINSGVMLMNLQLLRREQCYEDVFEFIEKKKMLLLLPDQDIISSLYGSKIYALDPFRYNMTEALYQRHAPFEKNLDLDWVREHSVIIHYCGRNKPWKDTYIGKLDIFYKEAKSQRRRISPSSSTPEPEAAAGLILKPWTRFTWQIFSRTAG